MDSWDNNIRFDLPQTSCRAGAANRPAITLESNDTLG